ncbi:chromate efflux transporter [Sphingobium sp. AP49]|uniref:chromate efflux transporter n=1 Tax=Sphingobium sp. AP49 TaxID=1144307 RepID=UPI00026EE760
MTTLDDGPPPIRLFPLFLKFLRFGCFAFGGPVAQIAMLRQTLVEEERWLSGPRFNRLLAVMQILPGPEAHELCVHMGMMARGRIGGLLAGLGFMLPGLLLMLVAAWLYRDWIAGAAWALPVLFGIQLVVLAIIARAVQRIGGHVLEDRLLWALAIGAFAATLLGTPFWIPLLAAGLVHAFRARPILIGIVLLVAAALAWALHQGAVTVTPTPVIRGAARPDMLLLFIAGLKGGLLTFGGAYTAIPYVRGDTVGRGWLSDGLFLDGVALAGILPAPLVIFATFAGYLVGGLGGALAITAGMFLPAFAFSLIFYERLEASVENPAFHHLLAGVAAAVVGVIAATLVQLGWAAAMRADRLWAAGFIVLFGALCAWRIKGRWSMPAIILLGGGAGWLLQP